MEDADDVPKSFICPITDDVMNDHVVTADGFSYERSEIEKRLVRNNTFPLTNAILIHTNLTPNNALRTQIIEWRDKQNISISADRVVVDESE